MDENGENGSAPFEVVFRGAVDTSESLQMDEVVASTSTDTSDLSTRFVLESRGWKMDTVGLASSVRHDEDSPLRETRSDPFSKPRCWREASSLSFIIASMIIFCVVITIAMIIQIVVGAPQVVPHAGVLSDDTQCSQLGLRLLSESAKSTSPTASSVDAAILTSLCLMVKNPHKGGLGGGGFMLIEKQHEARRHLTQIEFREMSPNETDTTLNVPRDQVGRGQSIAVPGFVKGIQLAHDMFGISPWKKLFDQASKLASDGVGLTKEFLKAISALDMKNITPDVKNLVTKSNSSVLLNGTDTLKQPQLAETLKSIGENPDLFYSGDLASSLVKTVSGIGSKITMLDMNGYKAKSTTDVLKIKYAKMAIVASDVPSSGPVLLSTLNLIKDVDNSSDNLWYHRMLEALKFSYGDQAIWGNSSQINASLDDASPSHLINDSGTYELKNYLNGVQPLQLNTGAEQHVTVIGHDRLIVTLVMGIGSPFGSQVMSSGYLLNNAMLDFSWPGKNTGFDADLRPSTANKLTGGKRPVSSMVTSLVLPNATKCGLYMGFDAHDGTAGISALVQTIVRKSLGMDLASSIKQGRLDQKMSPYVTQAEDTVQANLVEYLKSVGHDVTTTKSPVGACSALSYDDGKVTFYGDARDDEDAARMF